jgi:hypothetical protein
MKQLIFFIAVKAEREYNFCFAKDNESMRPYIGVWRGVSKGLEYNRRPLPPLKRL